MSIRRDLLCLIVVQTIACSCAGSNAGPARAAHLQQDEDVVRYRLLLRGNPVNPGDAFRCYGGCQAESTPNDYLACLKECPGFDTTPGEVCAKTEVPPVAACLVVRKVRKADKEVDPGLVVLEVAGIFALVVTAASLCASSNSQCGYIDEFGNVPQR